MPHIVGVWITEPKPAHTLSIISPSRKHLRGNEKAYETKQNGTHSSHVLGTIDRAKVYK